MPTLNQIAKDIAGSMSKPYDASFVDRLKHYILQQRALFYRRSIDKDGIDASFVQTYIVKLILVPKYKTFLFNVGEDDYVLRSENKIAAPVRYKAPQPFIFVGSVDQAVSFVHSEGWEVQFASYLPLIDPSKVVRFGYQNGYIFLDKADITPFVGDALKGHMAVTAVYENPFLATNREDNESGIHYDDDMEFPIPFDLLASLRKSIMENNLDQNSREIVLPPTLDNQ